ncbi:MAG: alkaline phosphatase PafA [Bacteroidota bacterium]
MKKYVLFTACLLLGGAAYSQKKGGADRPKIVVGMVIDQMRWDYLYRYYDRYTEGGFKRLMGKGFNCQNAMINYLPSYTAPGHACIYTGSVPSIHGIVANDFIDNFTCNSVYCVMDNSVHIINNGDTGLSSMSPANLLTTTITDELRLATNFKSRVYGISAKDRGSIIPAGHLASGAYWFDENTGNFVSSTYYKNTRPAWLSGFNKRKVADSFMKYDWQLLYPDATYTQSITDANKYEGNFHGEATAAFPHKFSGLTGKDKYHTFLSTPGGNDIVLMMANACIDAEALGQGSSTDFLAVSLSSTDYIGHQFGPNAVETEDAYLRLDRELATFLEGLDRRFGKNNYLLFLTADHGAAYNPQYLLDEGVPAGFLKNIKGDINTMLKSKFGKDSIVFAALNYQLYLNEPYLAKNNIDREKVKDAVVAYVNTKPEIAFVADMENMDRTAIPEPIKTMIVNGYYRGRSGVLQMIPNPGWFSGYGTTGTTHGTWHPYDTHIPLLWYGWNIPKGETHAVINMTDISATLAALLHIQMPNGCVGKPITDLVK